MSLFNVVESRLPDLASKYLYIKAVLSTSIDMRLEGIGCDKKIGEASIDNRRTLKYLGISSKRASHLHGTWTKGKQTPYLYTLLDATTSVLKSSQPKSKIKAMIVFVNQSLTYNSYNL